MNKPTTRLINPTKPELGKVSKQLLSEVIEVVRRESGVNQWKNTYELLNFYNSLPNKQNSHFVKFDICSFYPKITEDILRKSIDHAAKYVNITEEQKEILFHTSKSILIYKSDAWVKKGGSSFDVGMGAYDGAEKCDIVGLYLLFLIKNLPLQVGLFRDDGLGVSVQTRKQIEQCKKDICRIFKAEGLDITIEANLKIVDFLDVELNLNEGTHKPFTKPNNTILYIDANSNHPPSIKKNIPLAVQKRLSLLSSNKQIFDIAAPPYQEALKKAGYTHNLTFDPEAKNNNNKPKINTRSRRVTWFNPPFLQNVKTNVGAEFLKIIDSCFPIGHPLRKVCNRNTIKVSYRTTSNMTQVISRHNKQILKQTEPTNSEAVKECNCQKAHLPCNMGGKCKPGNVIYQGSVKREDTGNIEYYTGLSEPSWKERWGYHKSNITHSSQRHATCLSKHIWDLKDLGVPYTLSFKQLARAPGYNPSTRVCRLCVKENIS